MGGGWGAERVGERDSQAGSVLTAQSPDAGLDLTNREIVTRAKIQNWALKQLSHLGTPKALDSHGPAK